MYKYTVCFLLRHHLHLKISPSSLSHSRNNEPQPHVAVKFNKHHSWFSPLSGVSSLSFLLAFFLPFLFTPHQPLPRKPRLPRFATLRLWGPDLPSLIKRINSKSTPRSSELVMIVPKSKVNPHLHLNWLILVHLVIVFI